MVSFQSIFLFLPRRFKLDYFQFPTEMLIRLQRTGTESGGTFSTNRSAFDMNLVWSGGVWTSIRFVGP